MKTLRDNLAEYVAVRRTFGTQLREPAMTLGRFVDYLENQGAEFITTKLALDWARKPARAQRATWARRLSMVRRFATWVSAIDARTEIPPRGLLEARHHRNPPHIYSDSENHAWCPSTTRRETPWPTTPNNAIRSVALAQTTPSLSPSKAHAGSPPALADCSRRCPAPSVCGRPTEADESGVGPGFRICVTPLPRGVWWTGIGPDWMWAGRCRSSLPTSVT